MLIAISPASLALSVEAARKLEADQTAAEKNHKQTIERAIYDSELARRRYEEVDPSNRLVASELERRWEAALCKQRQAEEALHRLQHERANRLSDTQVARIKTLAEDIPNLWHSVTTSLTDKQHIVRELVDEVTVEVVDKIERVRVTISWTGGFESHHEITRAVGKFDQLEFADKIRQRILQMKRRGHTHRGVADDLNTLGYQSTQNSRFTRAIVCSLCRQFEAAGESCQAIGGHEHYWTFRLLSERLTLSTSTLRNWQSRGWLCSIRSGERWIVWADKKELLRLTQLAEYQQGPHCRSTPASLTTPQHPA